MLSHYDNFAVTSLQAIRHWWRTARAPAEAEPIIPLVRPDLHRLWQQERSQLPPFVQESPAALKYLDLLGPLDWPHFPERQEKGRAWPGPKPASYLVKTSA